MTGYLITRTQYIFDDDVKSYEEEVSCGVLQGSTLGPLIFEVRYSKGFDVLVPLLAVKLLDNYHLPNLYKKSPFLH